MTESADSRARFDSYAALLAKAAGHADRRGPMALYCQGLILPGDRKSVEPMAARLDPLHAQARHQSLHHLVAQAGWSDAAVLRVARDYAREAMEIQGPIEAWIIDDTGFPKKGKHSVGVAHQYCGPYGKTSNCQCAVSLSMASRWASVPVAFRLYLPEAWAKDRARRSAVGVPEEIVFQTKWRLALALIDAQREDGVADLPVLADAGYGDASGFRDGLTERRLRYAVGIGKAMNISIAATITAPSTASLTGLVIHIFDGVTDLGGFTLDSTGHASGSVTPGTPGAHSLSATYAGDANFNGSISTALPVLVRDTVLYAVAADSGVPPLVTVYNADGVTPSFVLATGYSVKFKGGIQVAIGDVNGDGIPDIITATNSGTAEDIKVFSGATHLQIADIPNPYGPKYTSGVFIAAGDVNDDGLADIVVAPQSGKFPVQVYSLANIASPVLLGQIKPFGLVDSHGNISYSGGVRVAVGDVNNDGHADIVLSPKGSGVKFISIVNGATIANATPAVIKTLSPQQDSHGNPTSISGGWYVALADVNHDGNEDLIVSPGNGSPETIKIFDATFTAGVGSAPAKPAPILTLASPFGVKFSGGMRIATADLDNDGVKDLIIGGGNNSHSVVYLVKGFNFASLGTVQLIATKYNNGVWVA